MHKMKITKSYNDMYIKLYSENPNPVEIDKVVKIVRNGGIIIQPTDSVYAVGCDAFNVRGVEKIYKHREIDSKKAQLSIICYDLSNISKFAKVDNAQFKILKKNLPGAFTFILEASSGLPILYISRKTIGIRVTDNNIINAIVKELDNPILTASTKDED